MAENVLHDAKGGKPTPHAYEELQRAFDFFNERLFDGRIPQCLLTLQRKARACGYYSPRRFINASGELIDEIALNPETFALDTVAGILSTQVHEMCHAWRQHFGGKKSRRSYHDRVWAQKMRQIGLVPSDTGCPGGKETGQHMTHYILAGGPFDQACTVLIDDGYIISWFDRHTVGKTRKTLYFDPAVAGSAQPYSVGLAGGDEDDESPAEGEEGAEPAAPTMPGCEPEGPAG